MVKYLPEFEYFYCVKQKCLPSFFQEKYHLFGITQVLYRLTHNSHKSLLSRYTAGYISDSNKHRPCSKVNIDKIITLLNCQVHLNGIFCALVHKSQSAMTKLFAVMWFTSAALT